MFILLPFPSVFLHHAPPSLLPVYLSIKSSQICGNIIKYVQEDVMLFEKCLHALIFSSETAGLPLPQREERSGVAVGFSLPLSLPLSHIHTCRMAIHKHNQYS